MYTEDVHVMDNDMYILNIKSVIFVSLVVTENTCTSVVERLG